MQATTIAIQERLALTQARLVAGRTSQQLSRLDRGVARRVILAALPLALRILFSRTAARGLSETKIEGTVELCLRRPGSGEEDAFEVVVRGGRCRVRRGRSDRADASISIGLADMVQMGSGAVDPGFFLADGISAGRIELRGDAFLFLAFPNFFRMANRKLI